MLCFIAATYARTQESHESALYKTLKSKDSLLFNVGFNNCDLQQFEQLVSDHFEFYHDEAGVISSKADFITGFKNNVCGQYYKARRELAAGTLEVYPLMENNVLYGAVQTGVHRFYALEKDKPEYFTSKAKFTHVWLLENNEWKLVKGLSYDHQKTDTPDDLPDFGNAAQMNEWIRKNNVPALAIGIISNGTLQEIKTYGELDKGKPVAYNSIFNVASITKTITAMTVLRLVSAGKWNIDEPLYHYWTDPDVKADSNSRKITTRHILSQQSGFPNWRWNLTNKKLAFIAAPGTKYGYSGEGFEYLRHALEKKFHKPLDALAAEQVFGPLGMHDTHYTWDKTMDTTRFAVPHDAQGSVVAPYYKNKTPNAADLVKTTIPDLSRFLIAVVNGEGLSDSIAKEMMSHQTKTKENRYVGLCWFIYDNLGDGEYAFSHGGDDAGAHTICFMLPKSRRGIIIFTNSDNGVKLYADILKAYLGTKGKAIVDIEMK